jgi:hypothetical protein
MRYTKQLNEKYIVDNVDDAINRLGMFEDMLDNILLEQSNISKKLEVLRKENQDKSYRFRELMGRKLINTAFISLLETNKIL